MISTIHSCTLIPPSLDHRTGKFPYFSNFFRIVPSKGGRPSAARRPLRRKAAPFSRQQPGEQNDHCAIKALDERGIWKTGDFRPKNPPLAETGHEPPTDFRPIPSTTSKNALFPERKRTNPHTKYVTSRRPQRPQKSGVAHGPRSRSAVPQKRGGKADTAKLQGGPELPLPLRSRHGTS